VTDGSFVGCESIEDVERGGQSLSMIEVVKKKSTSKAKIKLDFKISLCVT